MTGTVWLVFYGADGQAIVDPVPPASCPNRPTVTVRDFSKSDPDFQPMLAAWQALADGNAAKENARGTLTGVVATNLVQTADGWKPRFIWPENTLPYSTEASFDEWWTDSARSHTTAAAADLFARTRLNTSGYFRSTGDGYGGSPIIDAGFGFGDEATTIKVDGVVTPVNTSFTLEMVGAFDYQPGTRLRIATKSDMFVFVDHRLAIESGGFVGKPFDRRILDLNTLGLTAGQTYDLHIFAVVGHGGWNNPHIWLEHPACNP